MELNLKSQKNLSRVAISNIYTKTIAARKNELQKIQPSYTIPPDLKSRELLAKLILEEALETVQALGFHVDVNAPEYGESNKHVVTITNGNQKELDIYDIIDGCCDTIYVSVGCLVAMGVPDLPHLREVCRANDGKFPNGEAIINEYGKYQKPVGWKGPDHEGVRNDNKEVDIVELSKLTDVLYKG